MTSAPPKFRSTVHPSPEAVARTASRLPLPAGEGRGEGESPVRAARSNFNAELARIIRRQAIGNWMLPSLSQVTPRFIETTLRGAMGGNHIQQWELFDLMEDTWPRLLKNLNEIKGAVQQMDWKIEAWAEEDQPPGDTALERRKLISHAVWKMNPASDGDDNGFEQTLADLLDAWGKGVSVLEIIWEQRRAGSLGDITVPNCTAWVHPRNYAWSNEGFLGLNPQPEINTGVFASRSASPVERFPDHKFLVAINKAKTGPPLTAALLRPLAWWWCAANFSGDWLMNLAQLFGIPFRWATYAQNASDGTVSEINDLLTNMGSSGQAAFPEGTNLNFLEAGKNAGSSPQADLLERADKACDLLILGQTLTSETGPSGGGSLALGKVHASVRDQIIQSAANFAARVINQQLIPAILLENYGDAEEAPYFCPEPKTQKDLNQTATMIKTAVATGMEVPTKWAHQELNIPLPQPGEDIIEKPQAPQPAMTPANVSPSPGGEGRGEGETADATDLNAKLKAAAAPPFSDAAFAARIAEKRDPVVSILARIAEVKDDGAMLAALNQLYRELPALTQLITADVTRQQRALEQLTAPAFAKGLEGKQP